MGDRVNELMCGHVPSYDHACDCVCVCVCVCVCTNTHVLINVRFALCQHAS